MPKLQCKDIDTIALLRFIDRKSAESLVENPRGSGWVRVWDLEPPYSNLPGKLFRAKTGQLMKQGLLDGCNCGCRGDYELTPKGKAAINDHNAKGTAMPSTTPKSLDFTLTLTADIFGTVHELATATVTPRVRIAGVAASLDVPADIADTLEAMARQLRLATLTSDADELFTPTVKGAAA